MPKWSPRVTSPATCVLLALTVGCTGGHYRAKQHQLTFHGTYGFPIKGDTIYPQGEGQAENVGFTAGYNYFLTDRVAFMAALSPFRLYSQSDHDVYAGELQIGFRYHFWEFDLGEVPVSLYAEILGGMMHSARSIPEDGAHTNFTQDTGAGFAVRLADNIDWLTGYRYRHLSHGHVFGGDPNPGQNDNVVYTGIAITLK